MSTKAIKKLLQGFTVSFIMVLGLLTFPAKAHADFYFGSCYGQIQGTLTRVDIGLGGTVSLCIQDSSTSGYVSNGQWTSADPSIASVTTAGSQQPWIEHVTGNSLGSTTLTVSAGGFTHDIPVRVGYGSHFNGYPDYTGILLAPLLGLPGISTTVTSGVLVDIPSQQPIVNATVVFYTDINGTEICSGVTNSSGVASCSALKTYTSTTQLYEYFDGDQTHIATGDQKWR